MSKRKPTYWLSMPQTGVVEIHEGDKRAIRFTEVSLTLAIDIAQRYRANFKTEEAYQKTLSMYQSALRYLKEESR